MKPNVMSLDSLLESSKDVRWQKTAYGSRALNRSGQTIYTSNDLTGFERFMRYDNDGRLVAYHDSNGKTFERSYDLDGGIYIQINN